MEDNHEDERGRRRVSEQADSLIEELLASGVLERLPEPDQYGRTLQLAPALQDDFALNHPLVSFALAAFELIDPESEHYALDVLSVVESILDDPFPVLMAQASKARGEAVAAMKADGMEYEERMALLEEVTYPKPLAEPLEQALRLYRETHPWLLETDLSPKSVVRDMCEWGRTFTEFVAFYGVARSGSEARTWTVRQIINDPEAHYDWAIVATVDLSASDAAGEPVIRTQSFRSAG